MATSGKSSDWEAIAEARIPAQVPPLLDRFRAQVRANTARVVYGWVDDSGTIVEKLTFGELWRRSQRIAHELRHTFKLRKGQRVILCYQFGLDFIQAFYGCILCGVVPVPVYPPSPARMSYSLSKMRFVAADSEARLMLTHTAFSKHMWKIRMRCPKQFPALLSFNTDRAAAAPGGLLYDPAEEEDGVCFLQYTSGSTGDPKGVALSRQNLACNLAFFSRNFNVSCSGDASSSPSFPCVTTSWLPQYHDYGLIGCYLQTMWMGGTAYMMSPFSFLKDPMQWLLTVFNTKSNRTCAPNFAFRLLLRKWDPRRLPPQFHLRSLIQVDSGGEDNQRATFEAFESFFSRFGLQKGVLSSGYGLAEHTWMLCGDYNVPCRGISKRAGVDRLAVGVMHEWVRRWMDVRIVDPTTCIEQPLGFEGEIWVRSPCVGLGYWNRSAESKHTFQAKLKNQVSVNGDRKLDSSFSTLLRVAPWVRGWLRTGDLGYLEAMNGSVTESEPCRTETKAPNMLIFTSRIKDMIIIRGRNHYPRDIEEAVERVSGVRPGCSAAFSVLDETQGTHKAAVIAEVEAKARRVAIGSTLSGIVSNIYAAVARDTGLLLEAVVLIKHHTIAKTSSGKIRRREMKRRYVKRTLKSKFRSRRKHEWSCDRKRIGRRNLNQKGEIIASAMPSSPCWTVASPRVSADTKALATPRHRITKSVFEDQVKKALGEMLDLEFEWETQANEPLSSMHDSVQMAELSARIFAAYNIRVEFQALLDGLTAADLLNIIISAPASPDTSPVGHDRLAASAPVSRRGSPPPAQPARGALSPQLKQRMSLPSTILGQFSTPLNGQGLGFDGKLQKSETAKQRLEMNSPMSSTTTKHDSKSPNLGSLKLAGLESPTITDVKSPHCEWRRAPTDVVGTPREMNASPHGIIIDFQKRKTSDNISNGMPMPPWLLAVAQGLFSLGIVFLTCVCALPSWEWYVWVSKMPQPWGHIPLGIYKGASISGLLVVPVVILWALVFSAAVVLTKWIIIGRYCPGVHQLNGFWWLRYWCMDRLFQVWEILIGSFILDTALAVLFYKLMGARVPLTARINAFLREPDLISIGNGADISGTLLPCLVRARGVVLDRIIIGDNACVAPDALVEAGCVLGQGVKVSSLSRVAMGTRLPSSFDKTNSTQNTTHVKRTNSMGSEHINATGSGSNNTSTIGVWTQMAKITTLFVLPYLFALLSAPGILMFHYIDVLGLCTPTSRASGFCPDPTRAHLSDSASTWGMHQRYAPLVYITVLVTTTGLCAAVVTVVFKWLVAGPCCIREGPYVPNAWREWRRFVLSRLQDTVFFYTFNLILGRGFPVYNVWMRAMGVRVGRNVVCIVDNPVHPEDAHLVSIGNGSFLSQVVLQPDVCVDNKSFKQRINIGRNCSLGLWARLEGSVSVQDHSNVAWLTRVTSGTADEPAVVKSFSSRLGGRSLKLSQVSMRKFASTRALARPSAQRMGARLTGPDGKYHASVETNKDKTKEQGSVLSLIWMICVDTIITCTRLSLRFGCFWAAFEAGIALQLQTTNAPRAFICSLSLVIVLWMSLVVTVSWIWKRLSIGYLRPGTVPFESFWKHPVQSLLRLHYMSEGYTTASIVLPFLAGSALHNAYLRLMGANVEARAVVLSTRLAYDHDMISLGPGSVVGRGAIIIGHVFRDWSLVTGPVSVGRGGTVGAFAFAHCGDSVGDGATLAPLSKAFADPIPPGETWQGVPARRIGGTMTV